MSEIWFISDTHFGHKNILKYEPQARPFDTIEAMNAQIIENWNKTVGKSDIVYHLGDFAFGSDNIYIAGCLNGRKRLILGNHDIYSSGLYLNYFERLHGARFWKRCILTHIPVHSGNLGERYLLNVHGHIHSKVIKDWQGCPPYYVEDPQYFNVSCERNNLTPFNAEVIIERLREFES